jgi:hypothetical protein
VVSLFLGTGDGLVPQHLAVQFGYFSPIQTAVLVTIPLLVLALGPALGPLVGRLVVWGGEALVRRLHWERSRAPRGRQRGVILPREVLSQIVLGETTREDVLRLCGSDAEQQEQYAAPGRQILIYRGRRLVPEARRLLGWLSAVRHWDVEHHEVRIELDGERVRDVQAHVRRYRARADEPV